MHTSAENRDADPGFCQGGPQLWRSKVADVAKLHEQNDLFAARVLGVCRNSSPFISDI